MVKLLEDSDLQNIVKSSFTNKEMINKLNNLLISREIQILDCTLDMLDRDCLSYTRMSVRLTELRGEAVARQNSIVDEIETPSA